MDAEGPVDHEALRHSAARVVRAHEYFTGAVIEWLDSGVDRAPERAQALTGVLTRGLQLVAINLTVNENSQEIFETLNARGTPLTAADLIRNFVFQRLAAEGADTRAHLDEVTEVTAPGRGTKSGPILLTPRRRAGYRGRPKSDA